MMRLMQILKELRPNRIISFLQYMQGLRNVAFLCLCWVDRARRSRGLSAAVWLQRHAVCRTCQERLDWIRTMWEQMTRDEFVLENYEQFLTTRPSILVSDCRSLYDAIHKEGAAPVSTDKRLIIELTIVKTKTVSDETDLSWIDTRYQIADYLTRHASRKSETVRKYSGELLQKRTYWTNANKSERFVTVLLTTKNCDLRANDQMTKMGCRQEKFWGVWIWMCVSWYHRLCDKHFDEDVTRYCIWEQCSQLLCTTYGDLDLEIRTLDKRDGICDMDWGQTYCEHWKCVNRRLSCCRESDVIAWLSSCDSDMSSVEIE